MVKHQDGRLSSKYKFLLEKLGYEISTVTDDIVYFFNEERYVFQLGFDDKTPKYLSVNFGISGFEDDLDPLKRFNAVQAVNERIKCVKVYFEDDSAQFSCEQLIFDMENLKEFIEFSFGSIKVAYKEFVKALRSED